MGGGGSKEGGGGAAANGGADGGADGGGLDMSKLDPVLPDDFFGKHVPVGEIKFLEPIGKGAFGEVWKAVVKNKLVAVKKLFTETEGGNDNDQKNEAIYDFYHETTMMEKLKHKNIVQFLGTVSVDPNYCIITELMSGCVSDLLRLCRHKEMSMTWKLTLMIARDCAEAMNYLHTLDPPMIHRDLKSENLLIDERFQGKVGDFGLARFEDSASTMTQCGTPSWVAPEVFRGEQYSHSCDVYSFAILFWELVTQEKPHHGEDPSGLGLKVGVEGLRPAQPANCPQLVFDLLVDCWQDGMPGNVKNSSGEEGHKDNRPDFAEIIQRINRIAKTKPGDPNYVSMDDVVNCGTGERNYETWLATQHKEYDQMSMAQLKEECKQCGLNDKGNTAELVHRLEENEKKVAEQRAAAAADGELKTH